MIDAELKMFDSRKVLSDFLFVHICMYVMKNIKNQEQFFFSRPIEYLKLQIKDELETDQTNSTKTLFLFPFFSLSTIQTWVC